jgi:4-aminobutyrate aminotransferase
MISPPPGEGDVNLSPRRKAWQDAHVDAAGNSLLARDSGAFMHQSVSTPCLAAIRRAEGIWIEDSAGRRYMDFHGNNVHHLGHAHPRVVAAVKAQLDELAFAPRRFACVPAVELAERLGEQYARLAGKPGKVLFTTGGSDAVEVALKIARAATGRFKTLSFWDAFHGAGFGAASVGGEALFRAGPIGPLLPGAEHVAPFGCYRCAYGHRDDGHGRPQLDQCRLACANMLRYALGKEGDVAAVIAEPMRAIASPAPPGFWREVRAACDAAGALLIFDEIPAGLGKTGSFFAAEQEGVAPDMVVLGKALGGGMLPLAAVIARADLDVGAEWAFGHYTHEKNPVLARAGLETLAVLEEEELPARAAALGALALGRLEAMRERQSLIGDVRGRGLLLAVELVTDRKARTPASDAADAVLYRALAKGLSFKLAMGNVITLTPPLIIGGNELGDALDILEEAIAETAPEIP